MKKSTKAALFSTVIFPGVGLYFLKRYLRGSIFFIPALLAILYIIHGISNVMHEVIEKLKLHPSEATNISHLTSTITESINIHLPFYHQAITLFIASWLLSIGSSYFVGKKLETEDIDKNNAI